VIAKRQFLSSFGRNPSGGEPFRDMDIPSIRLPIILFFTLFGIHGYLRALGHREIAYLVVVVPIGASVFVNLLLRPLLSDRARKSALSIRFVSGQGMLVVFALMCYMLWLSFGFIRTLMTDVRPVLWIMAELLWMWMILLFMYSAILGYRDKGKALDIWRDLGLSILIYVGLNILGFMLGINSPAVKAKYTRTFEALFGLFQSQVAFPFTLSLRYFSIATGALVILAIFNDISHQWIFKMATVIIAIFAMIGAGVRVPVFVLIAVLFTAATWRAGGKILYCLLLLLFIMLPFLVVWADFGRIIGGVLSMSPVPLERVPGDIFTLSNRDELWTITLGKLLSDPIHFTFGFGVYGHLVSKANFEYAFLFRESYANPYVAAAHNSLLQIFLDGGIIGFLIFLSVILSAALCLCKGQRAGTNPGMSKKTRILVLSLFLYLVGCSATEVILTYMSPNLLGLMILILLFAALARSPKVNIGISREKP